MKKILLIASAAFLFSLNSDAQSTIPRWGTTKNTDNTGRTLTFKHIAYTPGHTGGSYYDSIRPSASRTFVQTATPLVHADSITIKTGSAYLWDEVTFEFTADTLTAGRAVVFATNSKSPVYLTSSSPSMTVKKSKKAMITFIFDGVAWIEEYRSVQY